MAKKLYPEDAIQSIASAIRGKNGSSDLYKITDMASAITDLPSGGNVDVDPLTVTENGVYSASSGHAFDPVTVSVPQSGITPTGTINIVNNGIYSISEYASANVSVPQGIEPSGVLSVSSNGIYDCYSLASVDVNVSGGGGGGDHDFEDAFITRTLSGVYTNSRVVTIGSNAFTEMDSLTEINLPNVTTIGRTAFGSCDSLQHVSIPNVESIPYMGFYNCSSLKSVYAPNTSEIDTYGFYSCRSLEIADFPKLQYAGSSAFNRCENLKVLNIRSLASVGASVFVSVHSLSYLEQMKSVYDPRSASAYLETYVFWGANGAIIPPLSGCSRLMSIYLKYSNVALYNTNNLSCTPMSDSSYTGSFGSIYVPASLVDTYKASVNWSAYADRITAYEE